MPTANDNAFTDKAYFCPACGSSLVDASAFAGGDASCGVCTWRGKVDELIASSFSQEMGSPEEILRQLTLDIRQLMAKEITTEFIKMLMKWGFVGPQIDRREVARYVGTVAACIAQGIIKTRQDIEKERVQRG